MKTITVLVSIAITCMLTGCASLNEPGELAWQAMHAIDTAQTISIARDTRYVEVESAWLIGTQPDVKEVIGWSVGLSLAHASITHLLIETDHPRLSKVWQYMTLSTLCSTVGRNAAIGIQIGGGNAEPKSYIHDFDTRMWIHADFYKR